MAITILALDDDPEEIELMRFILTGIQVDSLIFLTEEEKFIQSLNREVSVVIFDNYLNGAARGFELLKQVKTKAPKAKIIIVSGGTDPKMMENLINEGIFKFINKNDKLYQAKLYDFVSKAVAEVRELMELIEVLRREARKH